MASDLASVRRRAGMVGAVLLLCMCGLIYRAFEVAVTDHQLYVSQGHRQQLRTYKLDASRGDIVDRNYLSMAVNDRVHRIVLNPRLIRAEQLEGEVLSRLAELFPEQDPAYFRDELSKDKAYRMLRVRPSEEQAQTFEQRPLAGVRLELVPKRVYPRELLAAHILGRVDRQGKGNLGIEHGMDRWLKGRDATSPAQYAVKGHKKLLVDGSPDPGISRGNTVVLSIDSAIQSMVEEEINVLVSEFRPVGASVVVLDPKSGEILAMANRPTFDPNHRIESVHETRNLAVQGAYEPGSTMKAITVAAALEQGVIRKDETFYCEEGRWQYTPQHAIRDTKPSEWLDVTQILALSSNICTTKIADRLGKQALHRWVRRFHFGERPPIELPGANRGVLADWKKWSDIKAANVSFGQGMSASPLQVASAFAAIANGGIYNEPTLVKRIVSNDGTPVREHEPSRDRVIRTATAKTVLEMLTAVVQSHRGTGKKARVAGYSVAGKTSTAQKANPKGGYFEDQYYASFVGALPAEDPRVVILVSVDNPEGGHYGNDVAAPAFANLGKRIMTYLGVPREDGSVPAPDEIKLAMTDPRVVDGFIPDLDVEPALPGSRKVAFTTGLPDFTGLTLVQALDAADKSHVQLRALGTGIAVGQDTPAGPVDSGSVVTVHFSPPA
jgi:cell division protein FtsI (penicillin-binding protein 3)